MITMIHFSSIDILRETGIMSQIKERTINPKKLYDTMIMVKQNDIEYNMLLFTQFNGIILFYIGGVLGSLLIFLSENLENYLRVIMVKYIWCKLIRNIII